jgi:glycerol uptake facilitator-like aquaporin
MGNGGPGCFDKTTISPDITLGQLFGWEVVMTFTLISVVYACGIAKPGHGSFTPLVVGLSLVACAGTGGRMTPGEGMWQRLLSVPLLACVCTC